MTPRVRSEPCDGLPRFDSQCPAEPYSRLHPPLRAAGLFPSPKTIRRPFRLTPIRAHGDNNSGTTRGFPFRCAHAKTAHAVTSGLTPGCRRSRNGIFRLSRSRCEFRHIVFPSDVSVCDGPVNCRTGKLAIRTRSPSGSKVRRTDTLSAGVAGTRSQLGIHTRVPEGRQRPVTTVRMRIIELCRREHRFCGTRFADDLRDVHTYLVKAGGRSGRSCIGPSG